jgi:hypothetical protein
MLDAMLIFPQAAADVIGDAEVVLDEQNVHGFSVLSQQTCKLSQLSMAALSRLSWTATLPINYDRRAKYKASMVGTTER